MPAIRRIVIIAVLALGGCKSVDKSDVGRWWYDNGDNYIVGEVTKPRS